ncbi:MAG: hypothetical protein QW552_06850 [Ignisphaera sp.]
MVFSGLLVALSGVEYKICVASIEVPAEFSGRVYPISTHLKPQLIVSKEDFQVSLNERYEEKFTVDNTFFYPTINIVGKTSDENYRGFIVIANASNIDQVFVFYELKPSEKNSGKVLNISIAPLLSIDPGEYVLALQFNTSAFIDRIWIKGLTEASVPIPEVVFIATDHQVETFDYLCGIKYTNALIGVGISASGLSLTAISIALIIIEVRSARKPKFKKR